MLALRVSSIHQNQTRAFTLAYFDLAERAVKKIKDVHFDYPLYTTSSFEVKTNEPLLSSGMTHDECTKMLVEHTKICLNPGTKES